MKFGSELEAAGLTVKMIAGYPLLSTSHLHRPNPLDFSLHFQISTNALQIYSGCCLADF